MNEFKINEYITLKLENGRTRIYVKGDLFIHCNFLIFNFPLDAKYNICSVVSHLRGMGQHAPVNR